MDRPAKQNGDELTPIDITNAEENTTKAKDEKKPQPKLKEIVEYEKKNSGKKKIKVRDGSTGG